MKTCSNVEYINNLKGPLGEYSAFVNEEQNFQLRKSQQQLKNLCDEQLKEIKKICKSFMHEEIILRDIRIQGRSQEVKDGDLYSIEWKWRKQPRILCIPNIIYVERTI